MKKLVKRPTYLGELIENKDVDLIKIITGIRRCGKSSLLELFKTHLLDSGVEEHRIIHMNLESLKYNFLSDYLSFYNYVSDRINNQEKIYLLFDELQVISGWEKAIESFRIDYNVDIYITGSNAYLLSTEFATLLSGRYVEIKMLPLSFNEFLDFYSFDDSVSLEKRFVYYLKFGGMPVLSEYNFNELRINQALEGIYSTVILKDILQRHNLSDQQTLNKIIHFLASNIGSITSPNNIGNVLSNDGSLDKLKHPNIAGKTVDRYIAMLNSSFIFYKIGRYDIKGKQLLKTLDKNYIVDLGFRNMLLGYRDADRGHILENLVFLELIRRHYNVYIGKIGDTEIDFLAEKPNEKIYIQVTESLSSQKTRERELRPLLGINDNYEKIILTYDRDFISSENGIKIINIIDWMIG